MPQEKWIFILHFIWLASHLKNYLKNNQRILTEENRLHFDNLCIKFTATLISLKTDSFVLLGYVFHQIKYFKINNYLQINPVEAKNKENLDIYEQKRETLSHKTNKQTSSKQTQNNGISSEVF